MSIDDDERTRIVPQGTRLRGGMSPASRSGIRVPTSDWATGNTHTPSP